MPKKDLPTIVNICDRAIKVVIYTLIFLLPLFFLPFTSDIIDFNKQLLVTIFAFVALFLWIIKTLFLGNFTFRKNKLHIFAAVLFLSCLISTVFSSSRYISFWGWPQSISYSMLSIIGFLIIYFLVSNNFSKKEVFNSFFLLAISTLLAEIYGILQIVGIHIIPIAVTQTDSFNTVGSVGSFGFLLASLLPLFMVFAMRSQRWWRVLFITQIILIFIAAIIVGYNFLWWLVAAGSILIIIFGIFKRDFFNGRWMFIPMLFFIVSLFFIIFNPQIKIIPPKPVEVFVSNNANFNIDLRTLKTYPIQGSGLGTFAYDFTKYKDPSFNNSSLWNITFGAGSSKVSTQLATTGILGLLALLALMIFPIFYGIKYSISSKSEEESFLVLGILSSIIVINLGYFLYNANFSLDFLYFFFIASLTALIFKDNKTYSLEPSSFLTLGIMFTFVICFVFGLGIFFLDGQRYIAEINYYNGVTAWQKGQKDNAINDIKSALSENPNSDLYARQLAVFSLSKLQDELSVANNTPSNQEKSKIQALISDSVSASTLATNLGEQSTDDWSTRGYICQNLIGAVSDAQTCAIQSYDKAIFLSPTNPYLLVQEGNIYMAQASSTAQGQARDTILSKAKDYFTKAIALKNDYSLAYFQLGLAYKLENNSQKEIANFQNAERYSPNDDNLAYQIGLNYYQDGNWQKAELELQRTLTINSTYTSAMYYLGLTYDKEGKESSSISEFSRLLQIDPTNQNIKNIINNLKAGKAALSNSTQQVTPSNDSTGSTHTGTTKIK